MSSPDAEPTAAAPASAPAEPPVADAIEADEVATEGGPDQKPTASRSPAWARAGAFAVAAALLGVGAGYAIGLQAADPTTTAEYQELEADLDDAESDLSTVTASKDRIVEQKNQMSTELAAARTSLTDMESREAAVSLRETQVATRETAVGAVEAAEAARTFSGDGTYRVGTDIEPGTYTSPGSSRCYWARLSGLSGSVADILSNQYADGPQVVTITGSDVAFETNNCGAWTREG